MEAFYEVLDQLYKKVLLGATLENDCLHYIFYLNPDLSRQAHCTTPSLEWSHAGGGLDSGPDRHWLSPNKSATVPEAQEVTLLQLTVIRIMLTRTLSAETETHAKETYRSIIEILIHSAEVDSKLIHMLQSPDRLLAHMAAKCLASLLCLQLREGITLSNFWIAFCQKSLSEYSEKSDEVIYCLWILTVVIKEILKGTCSQKAEILKQFLTPLDTTFEVFYSSLFSQHYENCQDPSKIINSLMCFLELLELLIASRIYLKLHLRSQRLLFLKPCILEVLTWPVQAFVKRKLMILLKNCLLCKVGEDLCRGTVLTLMSPDYLLGEDMLVLAEAILRAVNLGLLKMLSVHGKPCFGGSEIQPGCEYGAGPDHVTLRAASLITVKSLEIKFQSCISVNEMKVDLQKFMSELLTFLRPHLQPSLQLHNPCEWLSRVFIEQDDDMLEAAKASLSIYIKLTREYEAAGRHSNQEKEAWIFCTHENGCNPHCAFLFFLNSVAYDASVLLDFLISSETCFLEYLVRYLKLLHKDWDHFVTICKFFDTTQSRSGINPCDPAPCRVQDRSTGRTSPRGLSAPAAHRIAYPCITWASAEPLSQARRAPSMLSCQAPSSLVDYDSSEDSETSEAEAPDLHVASSEQACLHQEAIKRTQHPPCKSEDQTEPSLESQARPLGPEELHSLSPGDPEVAPGTTVSFYRTAKCLDELQGAICRLQRKNLFPYNAAALLKLLKQVEILYNKA